MANALRAHERRGQRRGRRVRPAPRQRLPADLLRDPARDGRHRPVGQHAPRRAPLREPLGAAAVAGVLTFSAITSDTAADATGTATFFRAFKADGTTAVYDGSVGTSNADLVIDSTAIQVGADVDVTSLTHTVPKS
jgi:hypothetical protein